jgi:putative restriction endonuclease
MRAYVGITDGEWYQHLRSLRQLDEVNFWKPGGKHRFGALEPGELFLFKLHSPHHFIVGGGIFAYSNILPVSLAWKSFGPANGAASFEEMRQRIEQYRRSAAASPLQDYPIGCVVLSQPFFLAESDWIPVPADWGRGIQQGKRYDLTSEPGTSLLRQVEHALTREASGSDASVQVRDAHTEIERRYGSARLIAPRLGQGAFRVMVTDVYERRCAITGEKVLPVLEAAHIRPFSREGPHRIQNGILLRSDLHTLFDGGYLTVNSTLEVEVSRRLHEDFDNGRDYYALRGTPLRTPRSVSARPERQFLDWHQQNVYRG